MKRVLFLSLVPLVFGCAEAVGDDAQATQALGPRLGAADSFDSADRSCRIVARNAARQTSGPGWTYRVTADVALEELDAGAVPGVLYTSNHGSRDWWNVAGEKTVGAGPGFQRYAFELSEHLPGPGNVSTTGLSRLAIQFVPYLQTEGGGRVFDHNRIDDPLGSYTLRGDEAFGLRDDPRACAENPADAVLQFKPDWSVEQLGSLRGGGRVAVVYDQNRLPLCRATHNGNPAWNLDVTVRFLPSGREETASVIRWRSTFGSQAEDVAAEFDIPTDTTRMHVWFKNSVYAASFCETWDSNFGDDFRFDVTPRTEPDWVGNFTTSISRATTAPCGDARPMGSSVSYDTWARQRATVASVCAEVYEPGVTDRGITDVFDAKLVYRWVGEDQWRQKEMTHDGLAGNNARYAADIRALDPFAYVFSGCPAVPYTVENGLMVATAEFYFEINGLRFGDGGRPFDARFLQYTSSSCP